jgi:hypothetical protein
VEEPVVGLEQVVGFAVLVVEFLLLGLAAVGLALNKLWNFGCGCGIFGCDP